MKLHTREWVGGERVALLVHGITSDSRSWDRVGAALAERSYRAIAVDLRGHGLSDRCSTYAPSELADDLVETISIPVDLAIGHSLGGWILALAADRLRPARAVYEDPAWAIPGYLHEAIAAEITSSLPADREQASSGYPRCSHDDLDTMISAQQLFDPSCLAWLLSGRGYDDSPPVARTPSLVMISDPPDLIDAAVGEELRRRGFDVAPVQGAGHHIHRDAFESFMHCLDTWLRQRASL